jgi:hypothetical protein
VCDEQCSLHGGVCDNGVCEFRCSDYAGYTCQNSSMLLSSLSVCKNVLVNDVSGQHCAPSEPSILQQLEEVVVMPNYHRLFPGGARKLFNIFGSSYCDEAAKRLACWVRCLAYLKCSFVYILFVIVLFQTSNFVLRSIFYCFFLSISIPTCLYISTLPCAAHDAFLR